MIVEWIIDLFTGIAEWFVSLLPTDEPPAFLSDVGGVITSLSESASGLGAWIPWTVLGTLAAIVLGLWVVLVSVKGLRWVWGITPFSGGS